MNGYDAAGRLCSVSGTTTSPPPAPPYACTGNGSKIYASSIQYAPQGALKSMARGDTLTETWSFNSRMQPASVTVGSAFGLNLYYCSGKAAACANNNGNLLTATPATPGADQAAGYDKANRLASFQEGANYQDYAYDPPGNGWGNRWVFPSSGAFPLSGYMPITSSGYNAQNQLATAQYGDGRGNVTGIGAWGFNYDGENRLASAQLASSGPTYGYDGNGQRVTKTWGSQTTTYVYDAMGNLAGEYGYSVPAPCTTCYVSVDQLGSTRVLTDAQGNVKERHDFMPFGDELLAGVGGRTTAQGYLNSGSTPGVSVLFTGQYRETELASSAMPSGLDYFGARHHAPAFGRFMQADPAGSSVGDPSNPQSWHLYNYVWNNPLALTDPSGLDPFYPGQGDCADDPSCGWDWPIWEWGPPDSGGYGGPPSSMPTPHPNPTLPSGIPNTAGIYGQGQYGFLPGMVPVAVGGGGGLIELGIGTICVGSGVCEAVAVGVGVIAIGVGVYEIGHLIFSKKTTKASGKETASDVPDWARYAPKKPDDKTCAAYAARILLEKYGVEDPRALERGPRSEYQKIKKGCERGGL